MEDTWTDWYTIPAIYLLNEDYDIVYDYQRQLSNLIVTKATERYYGYHNIDSKNLATGAYCLAITAMPCDVNGKWASNLDDFDIPMDFVTLKIKKLPKPTKVSLKTGKRQVTLTFKKSSGAKKYEIYRSTKKNSGYKKVATISGNKYTCKKLKKGKKYYFKVRAKRGTSTTGIAYSSFTAPKVSGKVK